MTKQGFVPFAFDSQECAAVAHDLAIVLSAGADRSELNFSVADLEILISVAKGEFDFGTEGDLQDETN